MAKNPNIYKFEIIERIITEVDFTTKEEVLDFAKKVRDIALERNISADIKNAFKNAYKEIDEELTLGNLREIKKIIATPNGIRANAQLYYIYANIEGNQTVIILECNEKLLSYIVSTRGKSIIEKDYK